MTPLERRYRRWMVAYPEEYRREHESEILGTLLEAAAPGQDRPSVREGAALLAGGLRTRARLAAASPGRLWADGLRLGAVLFLALGCGSTLGLLLSFGSGQRPAPVRELTGRSPPAHPPVHLDAPLLEQPAQLLLGDRLRGGVGSKAVTPTCQRPYGAGQTVVTCVRIRSKCWWM